MTVTPSESDAFFAASRRRLLSLAYRMLGSMAEAEDIVQETWIRWHQADRQELKTPVAWLTTVATRLALDRLRRLQHERDAGQGTWLPDAWLEDTAPSPEDAVSRLSDISFGVMLLFERLTPDERAALLLHEVFDCRYEEIAQALGRKVEHCRQLAHRAKTRIRSAGRGGLRQVQSDELCRKLADDFVQAIRMQDKHAMLQLVAPDALVLGDGGVKRSGSSGTPVAGLAATQCFSHFAEAFCSLDLRDVEVLGICINGGWGAAIAWRGSIVLSLAFEMDGERIHTVYALARQEMRVPVTRVATSRVADLAIGIPAL